ncbi:DNA replication and repair protein RecF [Friedmanniella endophytica]|uniref:DNA replication and repair protein RecF n=1 Tax=Microlunatus kandeliicorticis TaxID=1759536 RepID=A0A7W3P569_9ACTN|nr:DNA replication/repair protein RecF [Microlunatus kandeliicorticis]MBA8793651.1 DNA replication and repair protein RecF [Microlunatus kandeliicorticis]
MFVTHLQLVDFRSYPGVDVPLEPGVTTFVGANGQGKTNLVEAVDYLATLSSHRVASEIPLVRSGAERALVRARVQAGVDDPRQLQLEIEITPGKANRAKLNRSPLSRARDLLGALRTVIFSPEDLAVVKGDPSERRRFLDELVAARWPRLAGVKADYDRVLKQRNSLLKSLSGRRGSAAGADVAATLDVWDGQLARVGAELLQARLQTLAELIPHTAKAYADIAPTNNEAGAEYKSSLSERLALAELPTRDELAAALIEGMAERRPDEIQRGISLVGPHRDDVALSLGTLPAKGYASHGESWSFALALRLGSFALLRSDGLEPVLVLDDVFAELDATRRERLAQGVLDAEQVLITAAVAADVPAVLAGTRFRVGGGEVVPDE